MNKLKIGLIFILLLTQGCNETSKLLNADDRTSKDASNMPSDGASLGKWENNSVPDNVAKKMSSVGVNSSLNYMGETYYRTAGHSRINNKAYKVKQVLNDGFSHYTYIISNTKKFYLSKCVKVDGWNEENNHWNIVKADFSVSCLDKEAISSMAKSLKKQISTLLSELPNAVFVVSLKPGFEFKRDMPNGLNQNIWLNKFEQEKSVREGFNKQWRLIAKELKSIPAHNLVFNLLNEPEFENFKSGNARKTWEKWATQTVDTIRSVSPERTIIIEGIYKGLFARHNGPANIIRPVSRTNIIYGFHYYPFDDWAEQDFYSADGNGKRGKEVPMPSLNKLKSDLRKLVQYSNFYNVPVAVTEIGVTNPCEGFGPLRQDTIKYAEMAYETLVPNGIGMTFWSLESINSPYERIEGRCYDTFDKELIPNKLLFKALRLP